MAACIGMEMIARKLAELDELAERYGKKPIVEAVHTDVQMEHLFSGYSRPHYGELTVRFGFTDGQTEDGE